MKLPLPGGGNFFYWVVVFVSLEGIIEFGGLSGFCELIKELGD